MPSQLSNNNKGKITEYMYMLEHRLPQERQSAINVLDSENKNYKQQSVALNNYGRHLLHLRLYHRTDERNNIAHAQQAGRNSYLSKLEWKLRNSTICTSGCILTRYQRS